MATEPTDSASDASTSDAAEDAEGDAGCFTNFDCRESSWNVCNICPWPRNDVACLFGQCVCVCGVKRTDGD
jgi:hypothetical protein